MAEKTCGHEGCICEAREDGYCSDYCARHGGHAGDAAHECRCGHTGCASEATAE